MEGYFPELPLLYTTAIVAIAFISGFIKGVVGFAMPLVMISGLTTFVSPELALAGLILPTLISNIFQSLRQGTVAAKATVLRFRVFLLVGGIALLAAAQLVPVIHDSGLMLTIGGIVTLFAVLQLSGLQLGTIRQSYRADALFGAVAGAMAGLAGVWGMPTVAYLTALNTQKYDQMRIQGVIYGLGSIALVVAHVFSGVLRSDTWAFSAALVPPALLGVWVGGKVMDRIDQSAFRRATLLVLLLAGLNLLRKALG